jgi:hypothetical protein
MNLNELSILSLYSAMGLYALAFIAFAIDLARRSSAVGAAQGAVQLAAESAGSGAAASGSPTTPPPPMAGRPASASGYRSPFSPGPCTWPQPCCAVLPPSACPGRTCTNSR